MLGNEFEGIEIKGLIESSFLDWDGKIVTTIYLSNCNFRCPFCHNWELIDNPGGFNTVPITDLDLLLRSHHDFLDGVCITGGEPTLYKGLPGFVEHIRELGFKVKLDTNGAKPEMLRQLLEKNRLDYIAMDIKGPLDNRYNRPAGVKVDLTKIEESIDLIMGSTVDYEFRTTIVPTILGTDDIKDIVKRLAGAKKFALQQFVPDHARSEQLRNVRPYDNEQTRAFKELAKNEIEHVVVRGLK